MKQMKINKNKRGKNNLKRDTTGTRERTYISSE